MDRIKIVVGNRFVNAGKLSGCISYGDWEKRTNIPSDHDEIYFPGQGLDARQIREVTEIMPKSLQKSVPEILATTVQTHKRAKQNILIADVERVSDKIFSARLIVQENNELLLDHTTGFHLQGMLFLEASRQMSAAASALMGSDTNVYHVIQDIHAEYKSFAFPIETSLRMELHSVTWSEEQKAVSGKIDFNQNGKTVVTTWGSFSAVDRDVLIEHEARFARISIDRQRRQIKRQLIDDFDERKKIA